MKSFFQSKCGWHCSSLPKRQIIANFDWLPGAYLLNKKTHTVVARVSALLFFTLTLTTTRIWAADIYSSTDSNGLVRWATQALDGSYIKVMTTHTSGPNIGASALSKGRRISAALMAKRRQEVHPLVEKLSHQFGLDTNVIMALIEVESGFNTHAISPKGARGLMQLMPATARRYGMRDVQELHNPERNLEMGIHHLNDLFVAHGGQWSLVLASYNAGQGAVLKHGQRIPSYAETMLYVPSVLVKAIPPSRENSVLLQAPNRAD